MGELIDYEIKRRGEESVQD